jgi:hypothetical protein
MPETGGQCDMKWMVNLIAPVVIDARGNSFYPIDHELMVSGNI